MFVCPNNSGIIKLGQRPKRGSSAIQEFCFISFHSSVLQFCLWENNQECSLICLEAEARVTPRAWLPVRDSHLRSSRHFYYLLSLWFPLPFWAQSTQRSHCMKSMTSRIALRWLSWPGVLQSSERETFLADQQPSPITCESHTVKHAWYLRLPALLITTRREQTFDLVSLMNTYL